jgi:RNA polymerase sigma-70 factor (ECF subfamily)
MSPRIPGYLGQRWVVEPHHLQGWPLAEVAQELGRSKEAVAARLFWGLQKLRELLQEDERE